MTEELVMVFEGGPYPDSYTAPPELSWPLPEKVKARGYDQGCYVKSWESELPEPEKPTERRGAKYIWNPDENYESARDSK